MQFKLLQIYRCVSSFATSLIANFVPLIIYQYAIVKWSKAFSISLAFGYLIVCYLLITIFSWILKKALYSKPQVFLCLRIIPIIAMLIFVAFLYTNSIIIMLCVAVSNAFNVVFSSIPQEAIYNFVSVDKNSKALGITRAFTQAGYILASIFGGLFLDKINETFVVIISLTLYVASSLPLLIYYIKNRKTKGFNTESIATIVQSLESDAKTQKVRKQFLRENFFAYLLIGATDQFYEFFGIMLFITTGSYFASGIAFGIYDGLYAVMCLVAGYFLQKYDGKWMAFSSLIIMALVWIPCLLVDIVWLKCVLFLSNALIQPFFILYTFQMFLDKARILGVSNRQLLDYNNACHTSYSIVCSLGLIGSYISCIIGAIVFAVVGAFNLIRAEKKTTKDLVAFLSQNEIVD